MAGDDQLITLPTGHSVTATTNTNTDDNVQTLFVGGGNVALNGIIITGGNSVVADLSAVPKSGGGGVEIADGASLTFTKGTIAGNVTNGFGGGVLNYGTVTTTSSYIAANDGGGGGGIANLGTALITGTTIEGNSAFAYGAVSSEGTTTFVNSTIVGNQSVWAPFFGDVVHTGVEMSFIQSTMTANSGGLSSDLGFGGDTIQNSLLVGNGGYNFSGLIHDDSANFHIGGYLADIVGFSGFTDDVNLFFADIVDGVAQAGDNGGPVRTVALLNDWENPAIDAGGTGLAGLPITDALGNDRNVDFPSPSKDLTPRPDLGAVELQINPLRPLPVISTDLDAPETFQSFVLTVDFGVEVTGFDLSRLSVTNATVDGDLSTAGSQVFEVTLQPTGGPITIDLLGGVIGASTGLPSYSIPTVTLDEFDFPTPVITITTDSDQSVFGSDIAVTISFDREVNGFDASDLVITNGELSGPLVQIDATTYSATVQYGGFAPVGIDVAAGVVQSVTGTQNAAGASKTITIIEEPSLVVTTNASGMSNTDGQTSLEEAIAYANSNPDFSAITFSDALYGREIIGIDLLLTSDLSISGDIDGNGTADVSISGAGFGKIFSIQSGATVSLEAVQLVDGYGEGVVGQKAVGSAIENHGTLTLERVTILGNDAQGTVGITGATGERATRYKPLPNDDTVSEWAGGTTRDGEDGGDGHSGGTGQHAGTILNYGTIEVSNSWLTGVATGAVSNLGYADNTTSGGAGGMGGDGGSGADGSPAWMRQLPSLGVTLGGSGGIGGEGGNGGQGGSAVEGIANFGQAVFHTHIVGQLASHSAIAGLGGSGGHGGAGGEGGVGLSPDILVAITNNYIPHPHGLWSLEFLQELFAPGAGRNSHIPIDGKSLTHLHAASGQTDGILANYEGGTGAANAADSIVYLHSATSTVHERDSAVVTINVNRLGDLSEGVSVGVRVVASGGNSVSAADFVGGVLPQSTIFFDVDGDTDSTFSFELSAGNYGEGVENLQVELFDLQDEAGGAITALGTSTILLHVEDNLLREDTDSADLANWQERTITYSETGQIETVDIVMDDGTTRHQERIYQDDMLFQRVTSDGEGVFSSAKWATKTETLNSHGQIETVATVMDDGTTRHQERIYQDDMLFQRVTSDGEGVFSGAKWATKTETLNSHGQIETVATVMDDGTTRHQERIYQGDMLFQRVTGDGEGVFSGVKWVTKTETLNSHGQIETVATVMDDGTTRHQERIYQDDMLFQRVTSDGEGVFSGAKWATKTDTFDSLGVITQTDLRLDDTDTIVLTFLDGNISQKIVTDVNDDADYLQKIENYAIDGSLLETLYEWDV
ncbi:beta strand repeat-containing protein [Pelagimonas varians]|uniref:Bacterial Ig-like domain-containing protein n=1 Tax=Pelagimonas varians TaxID=696760 RepID=A0A238L282_9RHOB|nr:Ig-like domain-containing protein [Pelagimonas varians]PYG26724.1 hypothetical protein C8N36_12067 [Pelagimonas varians]SMX49183.1 hypothetical protein PEV8663_04122 [Pelagimonas varians]